MSEHPDANPTGEIVRGTARMAIAAAVRQVLQTGLAAATSAVIARSLGASLFGRYAGGTAAFYLAIGLTDLGFAVVLARELAQRPQDEGRLVRATVQVHLLWSLGIALGLLGLGLGAGGERGEVMLVLSPAAVFSGVTAARQVFSVRYHARPLLVLDISLSLVQAGVTIGLAVSGAGPVTLGIVLGAFYVVSSLLALSLSLRSLPAQRPQRGDRRRLLALALPVGIVSVLASLYFTIDQVLLGWLVTSRQLGFYAAAVRFLSALVAVPGLVMNAGIPGLARQATDSEALSRFAATLARWLAVTALPLCVGLIVFARPAVRLVFGAGYGESVGLLRILMLAAAVILASSLVGIVLMALATVRTMVLVNVFALAVNVVGNVLLVPSLGVRASAWLTVACEVIVSAYGLVALRHRLRFALVLASVARPLAVLALAAGVGLALGPSRPWALPAAVVVLLGGLFAARAWPAELLPARWRAWGAASLVR